MSDDEIKFAQEHPGCDICGDTRSVAFGRLASGRLTTRCDRHLSPMKAMLGIALEFAPPVNLDNSGLPPGTQVEVTLPGDPKHADDREWFAAHPKRTHRVRPSVDAPEAYVFVRQMRPGERVRTTPFLWTSALMDHLVEHSDADSPDIDDFLALAYAEYMESMRVKARSFDLEGVFNRFASQRLLAASTEVH